MVAPDSPSAPGSPRLTERDRRLLAFAAEHRFVLAAQIARLLGISEAAARRRLGTLRGAGLLAARRPLRHETSAYSVTRPGLAVAGSDLALPRPVDLGVYRHDVGVGWLAVAAHHGVFGELAEVVGERRMRSEDRRADRPPGAPTHAIALGTGARGGRQLHYPDLVVVTVGGHRVAFELELSTKEPARRERILAANAGQRRFDAVVYLVPNAVAARAIERSATRAGARDVVRVQRFAWADGRVPGEAPAAARARGRTRDRGRAPRGRELG
jgi:DNA-binding transcriptional ArsR family regulator